jgi:hypothetical protein
VVVDDNNRKRQSDVSKDMQQQQLEKEDTAHVTLQTLSQKRVEARWHTDSFWNKSVLAFCIS